MKDMNLKVQNENSKFLQRLAMLAKTSYDTIKSEQDYLTRKEYLSRIGRFPYIMDKPFTPPNDFWDSSVINSKHSFTLPKEKEFTTSNITSASRTSTAAEIS
jgi:hypothetical protein